MASYQGIHYVDAAGIISKVPVYVQAVLFSPHAMTDVLDLNFWDEANAVADSHTFFTATPSSGVITDDDTGHDVMTAAAFPATDVVKVIAGSGSTTYHTYHLIDTAGDNDHFHITPTTTWGDETSKTYEVIVYPSRPFFNATCTGITNDFTTQWYYMGGIYVPNLICETCTSGGTALIYTR